MDNCYYMYMTYFNWNKEKNEILKKVRSISFEEVIEAINSDKIITIIKHPNIKRYPNQKQYIININNYVYVVPFVRNDEEIFLKTIIPNRKLVKKYLS